MTATERQCGECTLCCKVFSIAAVPKSAGEWCRHCAVGSGCTIYETRPEVCRQFRCVYLANSWIDEVWKPSVSNMVLHTDPIAKRVLVRVDPSYPDAWQREPYHSQLRKWAAEWSRTNSAIFVLVEQQTWAILPDGDVPFGELAPDETVVTQWVQTPRGPRFEATKRRRNVPAQSDQMG